MRLGGYVLLLLAHWLVKPTAVWAARLCSLEGPKATPVVIRCLQWIYSTS
jgi:hypothetical protein